MFVRDIRCGVCYVQAVGGVFGVRYKGSMCGKDL